MKTIYVKDFSEFPGARERWMGPYSGEEYRDDIILPLLNSNESVSINLDGVMGYGSSFLEEVFGGLIRAGISPSIVRELVKNLVSKDDPDLINEITEYVEDAIALREK
ncbi:TPA: STAS-like domain-containing protein [Pasteurella multocida]|uniref:STAS-like domain-containing protein n=1 Tax=Pasteurella multocida TaxID=747 RepID=UPI002B140285|nr:STAS-like domain-containing protein [Pasteurella multocida]HDR1432928.1 STAS-like domain-containing protein [Pasteurella multocida]HDR1790151.1 STAS-like domain-containing protein [Pasteurella multocida]HDR1830181.1 STAS-like domain-containing protein [Pasteurella multocida]HDR1857137.1 STAS-like domain-containing protein [Pasteurella multocida]